MQPLSDETGSDWHLYAVDAPKILVVDDEENISFLVTSALKLHGYRTASAANGADAIGLAASFDPHVILLDIQLPDLDGFEVLKRIRAAGSRASVLFLTARGTTSDRVRGLTVGGDDYMVKPFALEELVARVKVALRRQGNDVAPCATRSPIWCWTPTPTACGAARPNSICRRPNSGCWSV